LTLNIDSFHRGVDPVNKKQACGTNAPASLKRSGAAQCSGLSTTLVPLNIGRRGSRMPNNGIAIRLNASGGGRRMFVGHLGAGLIAKRIEPRLNLGVVFVAALFPDVLLWLLVLFGVEKVFVPTDFPTTHYFKFDFMYSHGLLATIVWTVLAGSLAFAMTGSMPARHRIAIVFALVLLSHFFLDLVVHEPEMPMAGPASPKIGLGLWSIMPIALAVELGLAGLALFWYLLGPSSAIHSKPLVAGLLILIAAMTAVGPYLNTQIPERISLAVSSLITLCIVVMIGFWADGRISLFVEETDYGGDTAHAP
jgi:hypothetical protein